MNISVMEFFIENVVDEEIRDKRILEVGSQYISGSVRPFIQRLHPKEYIGIDIEYGKYVDLILDAEKLCTYFGEECFDVVISTEVLEHVRDWRIVIENMKSVLKKNGYIYITTRSIGYPFHSYPYDFWRYEMDDFLKIFSDFKIIILQRDSGPPGVFLKAIKPDKYIPIDLFNMELYSMIIGKRTKSIPKKRDMPILRKLGIIAKQTSTSNIRTIFNLIQNKIKF